MMDATTRVERAGAGEAQVPAQVAAQVEAVWRRIALTWLAAFLAPLVLLLLAVVLIDPYDSGRFPSFMPAGSPDRRAPTVGISRTAVVSPTGRKLATPG